MAWSVRSRLSKTKVDIGVKRTLNLEDDDDEDEFLPQPDKAVDSEDDGIEIAGCFVIPG